MLCFLFILAMPISFCVLWLVQKFVPMNVKIQMGLTFIGTILSVFLILEISMTVILSAISYYF